MYARLAGKVHDDGRCSAFRIRELELKGLAELPGVVPLS
jgi:hypothetical protein